MNGEERRVWSAGGGLAAVALGMALIPLREWTSASNLAFAFIALTIVMAELGGRVAAVVTAVVSAMSLNFFLTAPYLTLMIDKPDDVIAFGALLVCGLIAAAFGRRRAASSEAARRSRQDLDGLRDLVVGLRRGVPFDELVRGLRHAFGLGRLVLRSPDGRVAAADPGDAAAPADLLSADTLLERDPGPHRWGGRGFRLPPAGGRLRLDTVAGVVVLDVWEGDEEGLDQDERATRPGRGRVAAGDRAGQPSRPGLGLGVKVSRSRKLFVGRPLATAQARHERLSKASALAVFASDALSSVAYATEEILLVLILAGAAALALLHPDRPRHRGARRRSS